MDLTLRPKGEPDRCPWCHEHLGPEGGIEAEAVVDAPNAPAGAEPAVELEQPAGEAIGEPVSASTAPADAGAVTRCEGCGTAAHADCVAENGGCSIQGCSKQAPGKPRPKLSIQLEPRLRPPPKRLTARRVVGGLVLALGLLCVGSSALEVALGSEPALEPRLYLNALSPDGRHWLRVWRRRAWPPLVSVSDLGPDIVVWVDLHHANGDLVQRHQLEGPARCFADPSVQWATDHAVARFVMRAAIVTIACDATTSRPAPLDVTPPTSAAAPTPTRPAPPPPESGLPTSTTPLRATTSRTPTWTTTTGLTARLRADGTCYEVFDGGRWLPHDPAVHGEIDH